MVIQEAVMDLIIELLKQYGWQAVVIAVLTVALIECIKPRARKFIKKENARHTLYTALNYALSLGLSAVLAAILKRFGDTFTLYGSAILVVNILTPIVANTGFLNWIEDIFKSWQQKTTESGAWKKALEDLGEIFGIDTKMLDSVATKIEEEYLPLIQDGKDIFFSNNKEELILNIKQKLAGFVENGKLQEAAEGLFEKLKDSWKDSKANKETTSEGAK